MVDCSYRGISIRILNLGKRIEDWTSVGTSVPGFQIAVRVQLEVYFKSINVIDHIVNSSLDLSEVAGHLAEPQCDKVLDRANAKSWLVKVGRDVLYPGSSMMMMIFQWPVLLMAIGMPVLELMRKLSRLLVRRAMIWVREAPALRIGSHRSSREKN